MQPKGRHFGSRAIKLFGFELLDFHIYFDA